MATGSQMECGTPVKSDIHLARAAGCVWAAEAVGHLQMEPDRAMGAKATGPEARGVFCHPPANGAAAPRTALRTFQGSVSDKPT